MKQEIKLKISFAELALKQEETYSQPKEITFVQASEQVQKLKAKAFRSIFNKSEALLIDKYICSVRKEWTRQLG